MEITSKQNTYIKEYRKLTEQRKYRRQTGYFVCEGAKLAVEAVKSGCALGENAYYTAAAAEKYPECISLLRESCKMIQISDSNSFIQVRISHFRHKIAAGNIYYGKTS